MKLLSIIAIFIISVIQLNAQLKVAGDFNGWDGETVVALSDGSYWIQVEYNYYYCYSYSPKVEIKHQNGNTYLQVIGCSNSWVRVEKISNVKRTKIDGEFNGFDANKIFRMQDGSAYKQKKYKYWYHYAYSPECLIYYYNGWKLSVCGKSIDVEKL